MGTPAKVLALFGPTGVGKTEVAVAVADALASRGWEAVAVSADALQVYRGLEIVTGVASDTQRAMLEHRLVSFLDVRETFSAGRYAALAHAEIDRAIGEGLVPLVVGGTGLYLQAALCELDLRPSPPAAVRREVEARLQQEGAEALLGELGQRAPAAAAAIGVTDTRRLLRAMELVTMGETPPARGDQSQLWTARLRHPTALCGLIMDRNELDERIDARVEEMLAAGAGEEVRSAQEAGASATARKALGFDELLAGDPEGMKRRTRRYARRQLTWMRKLPDVQVIDVTGRDAADVAQDVLRRRGL